MKKLLLAATMLGGLASAAHADLVLFDNPNQPNTGSAAVQSFVDFSGIGFGAAPRVLTLHDSPTQSGSVAPSNDADGLVFTGDAIDNGNNKGSAPTLASLGWTQGQVVALGYNSSDTGNSDITLANLTLNLYNTSNTLVGSFSLASSITFSENELDLQQGNGQGLFIFTLDAGQRAQFNALNPTGAFRIGLSAAFTSSDGGPDSFLAIAAGNPIINPLCPNPPCDPVFVPGPEIGGLGSLVRLVAGLLH
jgi:hypothetical protein